jgi:hypothetical protein
MGLRCDSAGEQWGSKKQQRVEAMYFIVIILYAITGRYVKGFCKENEHETLTFAFIQV